MAARRLLGWLSGGLLVAMAFLLSITTAQAAERLRVGEAPLAGFRYHQAARVWPQLQMGQALQLVREATNPHDPLAVRVDWQGQALGYLPRELSGPVAAAQDRGRSFTARIARLRDHPNPRERILVEVFVELAP